MNTLRSLCRFTLAIASVAIVASCKQGDSAPAPATGGGAAPAPIAKVAEVAVPAVPTNLDQRPAPSAPGSSFGAGFEGTITMHITASHGTEDVTFLTKGGKLRVDAPAKHGASAHVVFDPHSEKTLVIMDAQKMYMEVDRPTVAAVSGVGGAAAAADPAPQVVKTGKHEMVAGTDCEDWTLSSSNGKHIDMCVAKGVPFFDFAAMRPGGAAPSVWADRLKAEQSFPLRVVDTDASGTETSRMVVTNIEKKPVDDSMFVAPADYHAMSIPGGFGGPFPGAPHKR